MLCCPAGAGGIARSTTVKPAGDTSARAPGGVGQRKGWGERCGPGNCPGKGLAAGSRGRAVVEPENGLGWGLRGLGPGVILNLQCDSCLCNSVSSADRGTWELTWSLPPGVWESRGTSRARKPGNGGWVLFWSLTCSVTLGGHLTSWPIGLPSVTAQAGSPSRT